MNWRTLLLTGLCSVLAACGEKPAEDVAEVEDAPVDSAEPFEATTLLPRSNSVLGARVFFISPENGATVTNPVKIEFGIEGMDVVKAGENQPNSGHHHLLIDTDLPDPSMPIPADGKHVHFGDGSTSAEITLEPGEHHLQMLLGDYLHIPHDPPLVSEPILITVE